MGPLSRITTSKISIVLSCRVGGALAGLARGTPKGPGFPLASARKLAT
jgi:hypothetical protein